MVGLCWHHPGGFSSNRVSGSLMKRCATCWGPAGGRGPRERSHQAHPELLSSAPGDGRQLGGEGGRGCWRKAARSLETLGCAGFLCRPEFILQTRGGVSELCSPLKRRPVGIWGTHLQSQLFSLKVKPHKYLGLETSGKQPRKKSYETSR